MHFGRDIIRPLVVPIGVTLVAFAMIIAIGESLLGFFEHGKPELERLELWFGVALSLVILLVCGFLATRPVGALGPLDRELALGKRSMFARPRTLGVADLAARRGVDGTIADIAPGYILYARSGALARVVEVMPNVEEGGRVRRALLYAEGMRGASDELWIPTEAVAAVYPDTRSAFLAIKGDETEAFGWHRPPATFSRAARPEPPRLH